MPHIQIALENRTVLESKELSTKDLENSYEFLVEKFESLTVFTMKTVKGELLILPKHILERSVITLIGVE